MDSQPSAESPRPAGSGPLSVWVVDDDARTAQVLTVLLRMDGHAAEFCGSGRVLARLAEGTRPDVLIMSGSIGRSDAVRVIRQVREHDPSLPIVLITEHPQLIQRLEPQVEPLPTVLTKPIDYAALLAALWATPTRTARPASP